MTTPSYHEDMKCGACEGPLEDDRSVVCHTCTAPTPERVALLAEPCPHGKCQHELGDHGLDHADGGRYLVLVCCKSGCVCGREGAVP